MKRLLFLFLTPACFAAEPGSGLKPKGVPDDARFFSGKWYKVYPQSIPWQTAQTQCQNLGGQLAVVHDAPTWIFLKGLIHKTDVWLGASDEAHPGTWTWIDGQPLTYTAWNPKEPNNSGGQEHYLVVKGGGWNDVPGSGVSGIFRVGGFVCEWGATPGAVVNPGGAPGNGAATVNPAPVAAEAGGDSTPKELTSARERHAAAVATAIKPVQDRYATELEQIKSRAMSLRNLDLANAAADQLKNPGAREEGAKLPKDIADALARYEAALVAARKPVNDRYANELAQLKDHALVMKNLELAKAADSELQELNGASPATLLGTWHVQLQGDHHNMVVVIAPNHTCVRDGGQDTGKWKIDGGFLVLSWGNGFKNRLALSSTGETRTAESQAPGATNWLPIITMKKVK